MIFDIGIFEWHVDIAPVERYLPKVGLAVVVVLSQNVWLALGVTASAISRSG